MPNIIGKALDAANECEEDEDDVKEGRADDCDKRPLILCLTMKVYVVDAHVIHKGVKDHHAKMEAKDLELEHHSNRKGRDHCIEHRVDQD